MPLEEQQRIGAKLLQIMQVGETIGDAIRAAEGVRSALVSEVFSPLKGNGSNFLDEVCETITVGIVVKPADLYVELGTGVPALIMKNVQRGRIDTSELLNISHEAHVRHSKSELRAGDVVAVRSSGSVERTGDAAVVPQFLHGSNCIDLLIARPGPYLRAGFLAEFLNSPRMRAELIGHSSGSMQKHLNVGALKKLRIPVIDLKRQDILLESVATLDDAVLALSRRRELVRSQMHRALARDDGWRA